MLPSKNSVHGRPETSKTSQCAFCRRNIETLTGWEIVQSRLCRSHGYDPRAKRMFPETIHFETLMNMSSFSRLYIPALYPILFYAMLCYPTLLPSLLPLTSPPNPNQLITNLTLPSSSSPSISLFVNALLELININQSMCPFVCLSLALLTKST